MKLIIMASTINLYIAKGITHELKERENGATSVTPKEDYVVIEYPDNPIIQPPNQIKW